MLAMCLSNCTLLNTWHLTARVCQDSLKVFKPANRIQIQFKKAHVVIRLAKDGTRVGIEEIDAQTALTISVVEFKRKYINGSLIKQDCTLNELILKAKLHVTI